MSTPSALILRDPIPLSGAIVVAVAEKGVKLHFTPGVELRGWTGSRFPMRIDGKETGFDFLVESASWPELPQAVRDAGTTILYFDARGPVSAQAVDLIREAIGSLVPAYTWFDHMNVLIDPDGTEHEIESAGDRDHGFVPPPVVPPHPAMRALDWVLDRWLVVGLLGGLVAIAVGAMIGERH